MTGYLSEEGVIGASTYASSQRIAYRGLQGALLGYLWMGNMVFGKNSGRVRKGEVHIRGI